MTKKKQGEQRKSLLTGASLFAAAAATATFGTAAPALAQDTTAEEGDAIVVTGTRIARRDAVAESPILSVEAEEMTESGYVTVEQYLNTLPQVTAGVSSQSNNPSSNGRAFVDLRGLGAGRNLVLMDGRRPMGSLSSGTVDVNTIPAALTERVEIITGGAASTYGADAIAGVVNFIMNRNFEGFRVDAQYRLTEAGDGEEYNTDFTFGGNFADGRGNAVVNASYFSRDPMYKDARDFAAQASAATGIFPGGGYSGGTNAPSQGAVDLLFGPGNCAAGGGTRGFGFNPDGTVFCTGTVGNAGQNIAGFTGPSDYIATFFAPDSFSYNFEPDNILVLPMERWSFYTNVNLDLNSMFRPYMQVLYTNYNALQELAPTPGGGWTVPTTNPFIGAQLASLLASRALPAAPFSYTRRFNQVGGRTGYNTHDVWQVTLGTEGDLNEAWSYDIYASMGRSVQNEIQSGNIRFPVVQAILNNPVTGAGGACSTWNPFAENSGITAACSAAITLEAKNLTVIEQEIVEGTVTGDLFELPAGAVQIALGASYRNIDFDFQPDSGLVPGQVVGFNGQLPISGEVDWFDIFGEVYIPLLADMPLVENLSITAGYRITDQSQSGSNDSWKITGDWTVNDWLRFRAGVQTAIRSPSIAELFAPQVPSFPSITGGDPCNTTGGSPILFTGSYHPQYGRNGVNGAQVQALCALQAGVAGAAVFSQPFGQAEAIVGGNPSLSAETSDSYTVGFVLNSPVDTGFISDLYLSVDYWNIEVEDAIGAFGALTIMQRCFNRDGANPGYSNANAWCTLFTRAAADGRIDDLLQLNDNRNYIATSGIDFAVGFGIDLAGAGDLDFNVISTYVESNEGGTTVSAADPIYEFVGTIGAGTGSAAPEWRHTINTSWTLDALNLTGTARYIDEMYHNDNITGGAGTGVDEAWYFDLRGSYDLTSSLTIRAGVNNLTDEQPQIYTPAIQANTDPSTYDVLGRRFFVGLNLRM